MAEIAFLYENSKNIDIFDPAEYNSGMSTYIFEREKLERLISDFYTATGVATVLYDADGRTVAKSPIYTPLCAALRGSSGVIAACDASDAVHLREAREQGSAVLYTCHAGLCELIKPVYFEDTPIAFLQIGQFRMEGSCETGDALLVRAAERYGLDPARLSSLCDTVPTVTPERLCALENMLDMLTKALFSDGLIVSRRSMRSVRIEQYMTARIAERLTVPELCAAHGLSRHALYRLFAEEFGTTPSSYLIRLRLGRAAELLRTGSASVTEVAAAVGFDDYNYFIRLFKREYGRTPLAYRKSEENAKKLDG